MIKTTMQGVKRWQLAWINRVERTCPPQRRVSSHKEQT
uniref:Uncharacterized protein At2g39910 isoform X2 n=1 Tax=Rhizophora mucronata TaxID=61149 RepID=A0A2P2KN55_RHIMU